MPHFFLQVLVNPQPGEDAAPSTTPQLGFPAITDDPRLVQVKLWRSRTPDKPLLLNRVHIGLFHQPLLLLEAGRRPDGINLSVINRVADAAGVPTTSRLNTSELAKIPVVGPDVREIHKPFDSLSLPEIDHLRVVDGINLNLNPNLRPVAGG